MPRASSKDDLFFKRIENDSQMPPFGTSSDDPFVCVRLDGRSFRTYTRDFYEKPFDESFVKDMNASAVGVLSSLFPSALLYVASDEMSFIIHPAHLPFNGRREKILSVAASSATASFPYNEARRAPTFDARAFPLESDEILPYITWRRLATRRNAVSAAAETILGERTVMGMNTHDRLESIQGTRFEHIDDNIFFGRFLKRVETIAKDTVRRSVAIIPAVRDASEREVAEFIQKASETGE